MINILIDKIKNKIFLISFSPFTNNKLDIMRMNNSTPRFKYFNKLKFSELLCLNFMFTLINIKNGTDMLFCLWIINNFLIQVNLGQSDSDKIVEETLPVDI